MDQAYATAVILLVTAQINPAMPIIIISIIIVRYAVLLLMELLVLL